MAPPARLRRWRLALFLSVVVHVVAGLMVYLHPRQTPAVAPPLEMEVVQSGTEVAVGGEAAPAPAPSVPREPRVRKRAGGQRPERLRVKTDTAKTGRASEAQANATTEVQTDAEVQGEGVPGGASSAPPGGGDGAGRGPLNLSLEGLSEVVVNGLAGPAPNVERPAKPRRRPSVDELTIAWERQEDAVANVEKGRVDPILYEYLRGARTRFERDARGLADSIQMGVGDTLRSWQRGYMERLGDINRRGAVDARGTSSDGGTSPHRDQGGIPPADLAAAYGETIRQASGGAEERRAEVCLELAPGKVPSPALRRESGNAALDFLALDAFARSIASRPVLSDLRAGIACYEVRISAFRMPPVPILSCGIAGGSVGCVWPFKKVTAVSGRLLSVDYQSSQAASASRSLLRHPR